MEDGARQGIEPKRAIPTRVDDPVPVLFFEPLEFVMAVVIVGLFVAIGYLMTGTVVAGIVLWIGKRMRRGAKRGAAQHALWYSGMMADAGMKRFAPPWVKELIE